MCTVAVEHTRSVHGTADRKTPDFGAFSRVGRGQAFAGFLRSISYRKSSTIAATIAITHTTIPIADTEHRRQVAADECTGDAEQDGQDPAHRIRAWLDEAGQDADDCAANDVTQNAFEHACSPRG
jgi:hypothetical protein